MKEAGHWYRITSIKEERGRVWKDYTVVIKGGVVIHERR